MNTHAAFTAVLSALLAAVFGTATVAACPADDDPPVSSQASQGGEGTAASPAERRSAAIALFNEGVTALQAGDVTTANDRFLQANRTDPEFPEPYRALAATAAEAENWPSAGRWAEGLLGFEPANLGAMRTVYYSDLMTGDLKGASASARRVVAADAASLPDILDHGTTFFANNDFAMARVLLEVVTETDPNQPGAWFSLGVSCNALGDRDAARAAFTRFLEVAPPSHPDLETANEMLQFLASSPPAASEADAAQRG